MPDRPEYKLCGGTFFVLLLQARKQRFSARKNVSGKKDGLSNSELFEGLIRVAFPDYISPAGRSIQTYTSSYKACRMSTNDYLPFDKEEWINAFDHDIKSSFVTPLQRMCEFTASFIDEKNMGKWLVGAVLDTISHDSSITDDLFYVDINGRPMDKAHLLITQNFDLQPFLLGVWHFILLNRRDNTVGADTIDEWHDRPTARNARYKFNSNIGKNRSQNIEVNIISAGHIVNEGDSTNDPYEIPDGMEPLLVPNGIAPELNGDAPWILLPAGTLPQSNNFSVYLDNTYNKYNRMKTLLYNDTPRDFYDFYVCNNISQKVYTKKFTYQTRIIPNATAEILQSFSNFILISGTGGLGKSMMMRHLLLDAIDHFNEFGKLPIFIPLKDYNDSYNGLLNYIFEKFEGLGGADSVDDFSDLLLQGSCLLLFDGLDEIKSDYRKKFEHDLDIFADKYTENLFVISSRPTGSFISLHRFIVLDLCPFTKKQALELIDKLDFRPDEPKIKENFHHELENSLFYSHEEFTQNPLLLTIMLMTYEQFAEVPSKMHIFYREAYVALSQKHDASKGAYKRVLKTGLTADQFADYFAEFCARSYRDEKFEFTELLFDKYFDSLNERKKGPNRITASDFRDDLVENMCLMFFESGKYHFTHRSFQEYFCALYFSKQKDKYLKEIGNFFENKKSRHYSDITFNMLYDMIPDKIEEYIFEPFLKSLFEECDAQNGYWTFLVKMYPVLYYEKGDTNGCDVTEPESFIYSSIVQIKNLRVYLEQDDLPYDDEFVINEWVYLDEDFHHPDYDTYNLIDVNEVPMEYEEEFGSPEIVGRNYEINIAEILSNQSSYKQLLKLLDNDKFPLKSEYLSVREYLNDLIHKSDTISNDLFDLFQ